jgi:hypothetical protein
MTSSFPRRLAAWLVVRVASRKKVRWQSIPMHESGGLSPFRGHRSALNASVHCTKARAFEKRGVARRDSDSRVTRLIGLAPLIARQRKTPCRDRRMSCRRPPWTEADISALRWAISVHNVHAYRTKTHQDRVWRVPASVGWFVEPARFLASAGQPEPFFGLAAPWQPANWFWPSRPARNSDPIISSHGYQKTRVRTHPGRTGSEPA